LLQLRAFTNSTVASTTRSLHDHAANEEPLIWKTFWKSSVPKKKEIGDVQTN
jgi:hypothetical protein